MDHGVEMLVGPSLPRLGVERRRIVEAFHRSDLAPDHVMQIWSDRARRVLLEGMTRLADRRVRFALGRVALGEERRKLAAGCRCRLLAGLFTVFGPGDFHAGF